MQNEHAVDFFISYHSADRSWAEWVAWSLEDFGYRVRLQSWDFQPDENYTQRFREALNEARQTIAIITRNYIVSPYCMQKWTKAFLSNSATDPRLILMRVDGSTVSAPITLRRLDIDFGRKVDREGARIRLATGIILARARLGEEPQREPFSHTGGREPRFPGYSPEISNLPRRNMNFTGRRELLGAVRDSLLAEDRPTVVQALHGLGGVGKTQLALEYAHRHSTDYDVVWWIPADHPPAIITILAVLGQRLGITKISSQHEILELLFERLASRHALLIFDNAEKPDDIATFLPSSGHTLITSRNPTWSSLARTIQVDVLKETEAIAFLGKRLGTSRVESLGALAEILGRLPLALEQAAAYIETARISVDDYAELFQRRAERMITLGTVADYPSTLAGTWSLSLGRLREEAPAAEDLLALCAILAPDDIPRSLIRVQSDKFPERLHQGLQDTIIYNSAVAALVRYSLINATSDSLSVHRLVQVLVRSRLGKKAERQWVERVLEWLQLVFPLASDDFHNWNLCGRLLAHVFVVVRHAERLNVRPNTVGALLSRAAIYLHGRVQLREAEAAFRHAMEILEETDGERSASVARVRGKLGRVLQDLGDLTGAQAQYEASIAIAIKVYGPSDARAAELRCDIGRVLQEAGDLVAARTQLAHALEIATSARRADSALVSRIHSNLGRVLQDLGRMTDAQIEYESALKIAVDAHGPQDVRVAVRRNNLAGVLQYIGNLQNAREQLELAREIVQRELGFDDPRLIAIRTNLAGVLHDQGNLLEAHAEFDAALAISEEIHGSRHPRTAAIRTNLGALLRDIGEFQLSLDQHIRALAVDEAVYGPTHPRISVILANLGASYQSLGDPASSLEHLRRALAISESVYGPRHPRVAVVRNNLAIALDDAGEGDAALRMLSSAAEDTVTAYGPRHSRVLVMRNNRARILVGLGRKEEAKYELKNAFSIGRETRGPAHYQVQAVAHNLEKLSNRPHTDSEPALPTGDIERPIPLYITLRTYQPTGLLDG